MGSIPLLAFTWNAHGQIFCEEPNQRQCAPIDFWPSFEAKIILNDPVLVVFAFQHTELDFDLQMEKLNYGLLDKTIESRCLLLIYVHKQYGGLFWIEESLADNTRTDNCGLTKVLRFPNHLRLGLTNLALNRPKRMKPALQKLVYSLNLDYSLIMASLNMAPKKCNFELHNCVSVEPKLEKLGLQEGVENQGARFAPTCYLSPERLLSPQLFGSVWEHQRALIGLPPSKVSLPENHEVSDSDYQSKGMAWCDRIFYGVFRAPRMINCLEYGRIDNPRTSIRNSDHAVVYGLYLFQ